MASEKITALVEQVKELTVLDQFGQFQNGQFLNLLNQSSDLFRCHDNFLLKLSELCLFSYE